VLEAHSMIWKLYLSVTVTCANSNITIDLYKYILTLLWNGIWNDGEFQFYCWRKSKYLEKTTDLLQVTKMGVSMVFKKKHFNCYNETYYKFLMYCLAIKRVLLLWTKGFALMLNFIRIEIIHGSPNVIWVLT
jgi:hypothetical protein